MSKKPEYVALALLSLYLFLCPSTVVPSETETQTKTELGWVIEKIKDKERTLKTFSATFVQTVTTSLLNEPLHSEGLVYFDSAGKMLWKVTSPSPSMVLLKNRLLLICDPDSSKCEKKRLPKTNNILRKYFGIGQSTEELKKHYEIQLVPRADSQSYHLKLIPKRKAIAKHIETIEVVVDAKQWLPKLVHIKEAQGDQTSVWLQFTSINEPLPPDIFAIDFAEDCEDSKDSPFYH